MNSNNSLLHYCSRVPGPSASFSSLTHSIVTSLSQELVASEKHTNVYKFSNLFLYLFRYSMWFQAYFILHVSRTVVIQLYVIPNLNDNAKFAGYQ